MVLALFGLVADRLIEGRIADQFDARLETKARALATMTTYSDAQGYELDFADEVMPEFERPSQPDYFEIWVEGDRVLERSHSLAATDLARYPAGGEARFADVTLPGGAPGRVVQIDYQAQIEENEEAGEAANGGASLSAHPGASSAIARPATIVVATPRQPLTTTISELRWLALAGASILLALLLLLSRWAVTAGLQPLEELAHRVESIGPEDLARRIDTPTPSEVTPLVERLNELLQRVNDALARERRISADVAHELRTPIAELRSLAEVGERWPEDVPATRAFFADARQIATRMARTVETLLALARAEAGIEPLRYSTLDLARVVEATVSRFGEIALQREVIIRVEGAPCVPLDVDAEKLQLILDNLVENAVAHSPRGGSVRLAVKSRGGGDHALVTLSNRAPLLEAGDLPRLSERFWRKDSARTAEHSGLGLALVVELTRALGGRLEFELAGGELTVHLSIPPHGPGETQLDLRSDP